MKITPYYKGFSLAEIPVFFINPDLKLTPNNCRYYKDHFYLKTLEVDQIKDILKGKDLFTLAKYLPDIDHPLIEDIIGKDFVSSHNNQRSFGKYIEHQYYGDQLTLVLRDDQGNETLLPAILDVFIKEIRDHEVIIDDSVIK